LLVCPNHTKRSKVGGDKFLQFAHLADSQRR
jgi:hypothetical protein